MYTRHLLLARQLLRGDLVRAEMLRPSGQVSGFSNKTWDYPPKWIVSNGTSYLSDFKWMSWGSRFRTPPAMKITINMFSNSFDMKVIINHLRTGHL